MPERDNTMKFESRKVAIYGSVISASIAMLGSCLIINAQSTSKKLQSVTTDEVKAASYVESMETADVISARIEESIYSGKALALMSPYMDVFSDMSEESEVCGRLYEETIVTTLDIGSEWTKISSGDLTGFVKTANLVLAEEAESYSESKEDAKVTATVVSDNAKIYSVETYPVESSIAYNGASYDAVALYGEYIIIREGEELAYIELSDVELNYSYKSGYTIADAIAMEEEEARIAAEEEAARIAAEEEAARVAAEAEAARLADIIAHTVDGSGFTYSPTMDLTDEEIYLIAIVVDGEAGNQPYEGKLAVANAVLNRVRSELFPNTVEEVIYQRNQFSIYSNGNGGPSDLTLTRFANGLRYDGCLEAVLEAVSGHNNIGEFMCFKALWSVDPTQYGDYLIIGDHVFH